MALDKQSIERRDFPVGRRGYDQAAVDAHLSWLASEVNSERSSRAAEVDGRAEGGTLASTASESVRSIVAAAESSADEITGAAERDARRVRDRADAESQAARDRADQRARELVDRVSEATAGMLDRIGSIEAELGSVVGSVRSSCERLAAELEQLHADLGEVAGLRASGDGSTGDNSTARADGAAEDGEPETGHPRSAPEAEPQVGKAAAPGGHHTLSDMSTDEADGARLIALNMALSGTPRREAARYLNEHFSLPDADRMLDDVYTGVDS